MRKDRDFIPEPRISNMAYEILVDYGRKFSVTLEPPIPVDAIMESYFDLSFAFRNLIQELGHPDVLGAINIAEKTLFVDDQLDPDNFPQRRGRYHFTVAHELGHWVLHRHEVLEGQPLFGGKPGLVCRSSKKNPKEIQADKFASHLLMPKELVSTVWQNVNGSLDPHNAAAEIADKKRQQSLSEGKLPTVDIARRMASIFEVSGEAMQIRLVALGLVLTQPSAPMLF